MNTEATAQVSGDAVTVALPGQPATRTRTCGAERDAGERRQRPDAMPLLRTVLGALLRRERHRQQRTLAELAVAAGVSMPYLSEIERGRKDPSSEMLAAVAAALGIDLVDLVARTRDELTACSAEETSPAHPVISRPVAADPAAAPQPLDQSGAYHRSGPSAHPTGDTLALAA